MHHFAYQNGVLTAEDVPLSDIAQKIGTPFYCYSTATLTRHFHVFRDAFGAADTLIAYSVKANSNLAVIKTLGDLGAGADVVSEGELRRALAAGIPADKIVFSGVGKTRSEMAAALDAGIYQFNVESEPELLALSDVASSQGRTAPITLRVNPDVDAQTHAKITTGKAENKFGIAWSQARPLYRKAAELPGIQIVGLDMHIGSQITDLGPFKAAFSKAVELVKALRSDGHVIDRLDLGGGLGIPYEQEGDSPPGPHAYAGLIRELTDGLGVQLIFEPGRMIVGNAGVLVSEVIYIKNGENRDFLIIDAAMNDLIRPALYEAHHDIVPVLEPAENVTLSPFDVVGPVCETGDTFARERDLPPSRAGDLIAFMSAGAYGAVQAGEYNTRPLVPEVLVNGSDYSVIRPRPSYDDILSADSWAAWQR